MAKKLGVTNYTLTAAIKPDGDYLLVYFYPLKGNEQANKFFKNNDFAIALKPRYNLAIDYSHKQVGIMTLPVKIFLGSRASENVNNISTGVTAGLYAGYFLGWTNYVKLPAEEDYRVYNHGVSFNVFFGINKLELTDVNSLNTNSFRGSIASSSIGLSVGWHYKLFTLFLASGFDIPLSDQADDWVFKGQPWLGFGAGFEIF
ncbi:MAG TPA: hypothetical protein VF181_10320 [Balneolaceae bacterium]